MVARGAGNIAVLVSILGKYGNGAMILTSNVRSSIAFTPRSVTGLVPAVISVAFTT